MNMIKNALMNKNILMDKTVIMIMITIMTMVMMEKEIEDKKNSKRPCQRWD